MKTYFLSSLLIISLLISYNDSMTQQLPPAKFKTLGSFTSQSRDDASDFFSCPIESIYGQQPYTDYIMGIPSVGFDTMDFFIAIAMDNMPEVNSVITGVTFWGAFQDTANYRIIDEPVHFKLFFLQFGMENFEPVEQFDFYLTGELFMVDTLPLYRFNVDFPAPVMVNDSMLISVSQWFSNEDIDETEGFPGFFFWLASVEGDQHCLVFEGSGDLDQGVLVLPFDLAFCLKKGVALPLSDYALFIAMTLILTLAVFRFRHYWNR
jgi:hypothetical protein